MEGSFWLIAYLLLAGAAVAQALLLLLQAWEHRRFARSSIRTMPCYHQTGRVRVLVPCKGFDTELEDNLRAVLDQDYHDREVTFIVESDNDPACPIIRRLMAEHPRVATRLLVAGRAAESGQKVHNLLAATADLSPEIRFLAFADSDARPRPEWLRLAVARLGRDEAGATTGYRWFVPRRASLAQHLLYSINSNIMALMAKRNHYLIWGGSWAIDRETFESIGLRSAWKGTLSDDLMASRVLRKARRYVRFEPACVMQSPQDQESAQVFGFLRRQYLIGRYYAPGWWTFALLTATMRNAAWMVSLLALGGGLLAGWPLAWLPAAVLATLYLLGAGRGWLMQDLVRVYFPAQQAALRPARRFDIWAGPAAGLFHWIGLLSSIFGREIGWRGNRYRLYPGGRMELISSEAEPPSAQQSRPLEASKARIPQKAA